MQRRRLIKIILLSALPFLIVIGLPALFFAAHYISIDLPYGNALRNPASRELMETCIEHKMFPGINDDHRSLEKPLYSDEKVMEWLTTAAIPNVENFDYSNIHDRLMEDEHYFTPEGWCGFIEALSASGLINKTIDRKFIVNLVATGRPEMTYIPRNESDLYMWIVEVPVALKLKTDIPASEIPQGVDSMEMIENAKLMVQISRSPALTNPDRIAISRWSLIGAQ